MLVRDVMQGHPVTATLETRLPQLIRLLQRRGFRHLPVLDAGKLVGIISDRDIKQSMYWTAFGGADGLVQFRDDVYGRDRHLDAALAVERHAPARDLARAIGGCPSSREEASS